jgi:Flp pilus assembly protein TadD
MSDPEKTVFLSYRREPSKYLAAYVYKDLTAHGYDVFWDISGVATGDFAQAILNQIAARMHFVVLLSPESLKRCSEPDDWLRREIEHAMDMQRNIVPVVTDGFKFDAPEIKHYLTGKLEHLPRYQALTAPYEYLDEALARLKTRYLVLPKHRVVITPTPADDRLIVERKQAEAAAQSTPTERQLTAEEYFQRAMQREKNDHDGKIADYSEAIHLNPTYLSALHKRAWEYWKTSNLNGAISDYTEIIHLDPSDYNAFNNRSFAYSAKGDFDSTLADCNESIRLNPNFAPALDTRGQLYFETGKYVESLDDFKKARDLEPYFDYGIAGLAIAHHRLGNTDEAKQLWRFLADADERYLELNWVQRKLNWRPALIEEARQLIEILEWEA